MRRLFLFAMPASALCVAAFSHAQSLNEVVVTANRVERPIAQTLADVTTIDAGAIAATGAATVPELLRTLAGVEISQNGGGGAVSGLFVRGTKTSQTLILVDGVRLENPTSGTGNLEFLPLSAIDRIEIVRGPASVLYGSAAIGGVIQIFTRQGSGPPRPFVTAGGGSQSSGLVQAGISGSTGAQGATQFSVSVAAERTAGFEATRPYSPNYQADIDGNARRSASASLRQVLTRDWEIGTTALATSGRTQYDDAFSTPQTARMNYRSSGLTGFVKGRPTQDWQTELRVGETRIDYSFDAFSFAPHTSSQTFVWLNTVALASGSLLLGVEQLRQRIDGEGLTTGPYAYVRDSRRTDSVFTAYEVSLGRNLLRLQLRSDHIETIGTEPTGSVAWGIRLTPQWLLRASYASAFRAPTFDDLYSPFGANPALRPERSRGGEVAIEHRDADQLFKATAFASRISDAIELDSAFVPRNLDSARVNGVTFEARRRFGALTLNGSATLQDPRGERYDPAGGDVVSGQLSRRARRLASLGAQWQPGAWRLGAEWLLQGPRVDSDGHPMAGYGVLNLTAAWQMSPAWELFGRISNVGDKPYETAWGYNMPPRSLFAGLRYQLQ